jgi:S1-C subfamily serine protease
MRSPATLVLVLALLLGACGGGDGGADKQSLSVTGGSSSDSSEGAGTLAQVPGIYRKLEPSVVAVVVRSGAGGGEGSGVVVRPDKILTNNHVVEGAEDVRVRLASGSEVKARVEATDPLTDLALLDVGRDDLPVARLASRLPIRGALAVAIGNPLGFEGSVTAGIVSGLDRSVPSGGQTPALVGLIQTDAPISPGNSGGALVGADASVIGINVAYIPPEGGAVAIGFAIPAPTARTVVDDLLKDGKAEHAYLGVELRPLTPDIVSQLNVSVDAGAVVSAVVRSSPADRAGVRPGDIVVRIADRDVREVEDAFAELREHRPGERVELELLRDGKRQTVTVTLARRPDPGR